MSKQKVLAGLLTGVLLAQTGLVAVATTESTPPIESSGVSSSSDATEPSSTDPSSSTEPTLSVEPSIPSDDSTASEPSLVTEPSLTPTEPSQASQPAPSEEVEESAVQEGYRIYELYRLYNPITREHLLTLDAYEYQVLGTRGWSQEGKVWKTVEKTAPIGQPVYRMYHPGLKVHLYTKDANEYAVLATRGWRQEGLSFRSEGTYPIYRMYHSGIKRHLYTQDINEYTILASRGWKQEGVAFYGLGPIDKADNPSPQPPAPVDPKVKAQADLDEAKRALAAAQKAEQDAKAKLAQAQAADAQRASRIKTLTSQQTAQQAKAKQTAQALAQATTDAQRKADAKKAADKKVTDLQQQLAASQYTIPKLSPQVIDAYKAFVGKKSTANKDALFDAVDAWFGDLGHYKAAAVTPIDTTVVDPANMTFEQAKALSLYNAHVVNNLRQQIWGDKAQKLIVTDASVRAAMQIANNYRFENDNSGDHSRTALDNDGQDSVKWSSENIAFINPNTTTMSKFYQDILFSSIDTWGGDYNHNYGHITNMIGIGMQGSRDGASAIVSSVTLDGFGRRHSLTFSQYGNQTIFESPYDTTAFQAHLAAAKTKQTQANQAHTAAQAALKEAQAADKQAKAALAATTAQLKTLQAGPQTPAAQAALAKATQARQAAEDRVAKAQKALDDLN